MIAATMFSGIGAPETAMPSWRWAWCAEIEKFPAAVLTARHPESVNLGDVSADDFAERAAEIARPDVLVFGSPCQDFSIAGRRAGMDGKRGNLSMVALDILGKLRPGWFVFENVPGLLSIDKGRGFRWWLNRVDELGYSGAWASLDAQYFGVAQRRNRVFFVGYLGDWRRAAAVLLEPEGLCGDSAPRREAGQEFAPSVASSLTSSGRGVERAGETRGQYPVIAMTLNAKGGSGRIDGKSETFVTHALRADGFDASEDGTGRGTPLVCGAICKDSFSGGAGGRPDGAAQNHFIAFSAKDYDADAQDDLSPTLRAGGHTSSRANAGVMPAVAFAQNSRDEIRLFGGDGHVVGALAAEPGMKQQSYVASSAVRRLTTRECERLQGFPDDYTAITYRGKRAADGPRYKALGNSMAVPVMRWILSRIEKVEAA